MGDLVVIRDHLGNQLVTTGPLTIGLVHQVARKFIDHESTELANKLYQVFGRHLLRFYAVDQQSTKTIVTFSARARPDVLTYRRCPIRIFEPHASPFWLELASADVHLKSEQSSIEPGPAYLGLP